MTIPLHSRRTAKPCQVRTPPRSSSPAVHSLLSLTFRIRLSVFSETCARDIRPRMCPLSLSKGSSLSPALFSPHHGVLFSFSCTLFHFWITVIPCPSRSLRTLPQKTGGTPPRGHTILLHLLSPLFPLHANASLVSLLFPLLTQKQGGVPPPKNVGAPTFLIFPLIFRTFSLLSRSTTFRSGKRAGMKASATWKKEEREAEGRASSAPTDADAKRSQERPRNWPPVCYINTVLHAYCASPSQNGTYQNPGYLPGARPAGMSPFCLQVPRCRR